MLWKTLGRFFGDPEELGTATPAKDRFGFFHSVVQRNTKQVSLLTREMKREEGLLCCSPPNS